MQHSGPGQHRLHHVHPPLNILIEKIYNNYYSDGIYDFKKIYKEIKNVIEKHDMTKADRLILYCKLLSISNDKNDGWGATKYLTKAQGIDYHPYREFCLLITKYGAEDRIVHLFRFLHTTPSIDDFTKAKVMQCIAMTHRELKNYIDSFYYYVIAMSIGGLNAHFIDHLGLINVIDILTNHEKYIDSQGLTYYEQVCIDVIKRCLKNDNRVAALIALETHYFNGIAQNLHFWRAVHIECNIKTFLPELLNYKFHFPLAHATHLYTFTNLFSYLLYRSRLPKKPVYLRETAGFYYINFDSENG